MKIATRVVWMAVAAACVTASASLADDEKKIDVATAPPAVQAAVKKVVGDGKVTGFSTEDEDGKTTFEVEYKAGDAERSATFSSDGKVTEEEEDLKAADVPAAISAAVAKAAPTGKMGDVSKVKADGKTYYEADVMVGKDKHELKISLDGTVTSNKIEKDDDDEKDEKKEGEHKM